MRVIPDELLRLVELLRLQEVLGVGQGLVGQDGGQEVLFQGRAVLHGRLGLKLLGLIWARK